MVQQAKELLSDVARHRADPEITPDTMKRCAAAVDDLESAIAENSYSAVGAANNSRAYVEHRFGANERPFCA